MKLAAAATLDGWHALRDRLLGNAQFRRLAARLPLTRFIARRRARQAFGLCAGFVSSQVLQSCVRLRVLEALAESPHTLPALARRIGLPESGAERLVGAAVAIGLLEQRSHRRYGLSALGAAIGTDRAVAAMVEHNALLYADLADPVPLLRGEVRDTRVRQYWAYAQAQAPAALDATRVAPYSALMSASQPLISDQVLAAYSFARHRCLLDVGGGQGEFAAAVAARYPQLGLIVFDLPPVIELARARLAARGLRSRVRVAGGDFFRDPLPRGADVATLVRVLHDHDDTGAAAILANVRRALEPGAVLLVAEPLAGSRGAAAPVDAYFALYLLAMGSGRLRTYAELAQLLRDAGFRRVQRHATDVPTQTSLVCARAG